MKMKKIFLFLILGFFLISLVSASINFRISDETVFSVSSGDGNYILENFGIGTTTPTSKLHVIGNITSTDLISADSVTISNDFNLGNGLVFIDKSNGVINFGSLILGTDRLNVFAPTTGVQTGIASFYDSSQNIKFRMRDEWTANSIPPRFESHSALGFGLLTTQDAPFIWYVDGTNNEKMRLTSTGLGIGTTSPSAKLDVQGNVIINSTATFGTVLEVRGDSLDAGIILHAYSNNSDGLPRNIVEIHNDNPASSSAITLRIQQDSSSDIINLFNGSTEVFTVLATGNVGIGTTTPGELLEVSGGNIEIDANFTIGSIDGFTVGGSPGFIDFGIKKGGAENRFAGIRIEEVSEVGGLFGTLRFFTDSEGTDFSTERMTILGTGEVGIGTTTPTHKLNVIGDLNITGNYIINGSIGFTGSCLNVTYSGGIAVTCND